MTRLSRREFAALTVSAAAASFGLPATSAAATLTAQALIDRIKKNIGVEWKAESPDGLRAGDPLTAVKGVVTTSMATLNVLQQGVKAGANFFVTAQPAFYGRSDSPAASADPIIKAKNDYVAKNGIIIFRLTDHWRQRQPEPFLQGMAAALGWTRYQQAADAARFDVPAMTLAALAADAKDRFESRGGIRAVGDPRLKIQRVGLLPGTTPIQSSLRMFPDVDAVVAGEVREWESVEYARDNVFAGRNKALILLGRVVSEEPGMDVCASWIKTLVPEVPVRHIAAGDPYWRPAR